MSTFSENQSAVRGMVSSFRTRAIEGRSKSPGSVGFEQAATSGFQSPFSAGGDEGSASYDLFRHWVFVGIHAIANRAAGQPLCVGKLKGATENPESQVSAGGLYHKRTMTPQIRRKSADKELEIIADHELLDLIQQPNAVQNKHALLYMTVANLYIRGEAYWILDQEQGELRVWAVPATWVTPIHKKGFFAEYKIGFGDGKPPRPIPAENVIRFFFADPGSIVGATSPVATQLQAILADNSIQEAQKSSYDQGIFPKLALKVGRLPGMDGKPTDKRPVLNGPQRRALYKAVYQLWGHVVKAGMPALIDGLIEDIMPISRTVREMDFLKSGEQIKHRIFQALGVHPFIVGEHVNVGGYAQANVIVQAFCENVINPLLDQLSMTLTARLGPEVDDGERTVIWFEACEPTDPSLRLKAFETGRRNGDIAGNEYRAELGLPPEDTPDILRDPSNLTHIGNFLSKVDTESGALTPDLAEAILGVYGLTGEALSNAQRGKAFGGRSLISGGKAPRASRGLTKNSVRRMHHKQFEGGQKALQDALRKFFRTQVRSITSEMERQFGEMEAPGMEDVDTILDSVFRPADWDSKLIDAAAPPLATSMAGGAMAQLILHEETVARTEPAIARACESMRTKTSTATEWLAGEGDILPGLPTELPKWLQLRITDEIKELFDQPYWQEVNATTREDIRKAIVKGIKDGHSMRRIKKGIESLNKAYSDVRAMRVARTEVNGMLNAGAKASLDQLATTTGGIINASEWNSVFADTSREDHMDADGQVRAAPNGQFDIGGEQARYPGDYTLSAKQRINCLCFLLSANVAQSLIDF